jgi:DNA polymerase
MSTDLASEAADLASELRSVVEAWRANGHRLDLPGEGSSGLAARAAVQESEPTQDRTAEPPLAPTSSGEEPGSPGTGLPLWSRLARSAPTPGSAATLQELREILGDCRRCGLCEGRKKIVFGVGAESPELVVVGEGPGAREDELGEPFVGAAGEMLDKMLENVLKRPRTSVYILNVVKCRPPGNRDPEPEEVEACRPFLERQIALLRPKALLVLGTVAYKALFGKGRGIKAARGQWHEWRGVPAMPTFHPAYLLRQPDDKRLTLADLRALADRLGPPH